MTVNNGHDRPVTSEKVCVIRFKSHREASQNLTEHTIGLVSYISRFDMATWVNDNKRKEANIHVIWTFYKTYINKSQHIAS